MKSDTFAITDSSAYEIPHLSQREDMCASVLGDPVYTELNENPYDTVPDDFIQSLSDRGCVNKGCES